jgi:hypothetical protein
MALMVWIQWCFPETWYPFWPANGNLNQSKLD